MQYLNARYLDPELGMFIQPDWFEVTDAGVGTNRYAYSFNDSVNKLDLSGNQNVDLGAAAEMQSRMDAGESGFDAATSIAERKRDDGLKQTAGIFGGLALVFGLEAAPAAVVAVTAESPPIAIGLAEVATAEATGMVVPAGTGVKLHQVVVNGRRGLISEAKQLSKMGLPKNTKKVSTAEGNAIPDALSSVLSVEIKDTKVVANTKQVRIQTEAAKDSGRTSILVTGTKTKITPAAEKAFDAIIRVDELGPQ